MPDRLIRDELLDSDRWLDLPTDTDRLAYFEMRMKSDDFGNIEGGTRKLYRFFAPRTQLKSEEATATTLSHLVDADLIRPYTVGAHEFYHLPRSREGKSYLVRKCPPSPWCDPATPLGKHIRSVRNQGLAKNLPVTSQERTSDVLQGVGVGVGVGVGEKLSTLKVGVQGEEVRKQKATRGTRLPRDWKVSEEWIEWTLAAFPKLDRAAVIRKSIVFRDYWAPKTGPNATKLDWLATWRNWIRKDQGYA